MITLPWEALDDNVERLMIPGGWLVRCWSAGIGYTDSHPINMVYIPDPGYKWELEEEEDLEE